MECRIVRVVREGAESQCGLGPEVSWVSLTH